MTNPVPEPLHSYIAPKPIPGIMWERDHCRPLSAEEWKYWMRHILPFGWGIIADPKPLPTKLYPLTNVLGEGANSSKLPTDPSLSVIFLALAYAFLALMVGVIAISIALHFGWL